MIFKNLIILNFFYLMLRKVRALSRKLRVNFFYLISIVKAFILI